MRRNILIWALLPAAMALSACSGGDEEPAATESQGGGLFGDIGTLWGEESSKTKAERAERLRLAQIKVPVTAVRSVELQ